MAQSFGPLNMMIFGEWVEPAHVVSTADELTACLAPLNMVIVGEWAEYKPVRRG
jgi:hypothetical protein